MITNIFNADSSSCIGVRRQSFLDLDDVLLLPAVSDRLFFYNTYCCSRIVSSLLTFSIRRTICARGQRRYQSLRNTRFPFPEEPPLRLIVQNPKHKSAPNGKHVKRRRRFD